MNHENTTTVMETLRVNDASAPDDTKASAAYQDSPTTPTPTQFTNPTNPSNPAPKTALQRPRTITLDIGGRKFKVSPHTLTSESGLFRHQLSENFTWEPEADGSYFLDADPDIFEHLLRFARRPEVFPLFYSQTNGFDYDLYNRLEAEALYFQMDALYEWVKEKKYLSAIQVQTLNSNLGRFTPVGVSVPETHPVSRTEERYFVPQTRKVYLCPRQVVVHRGRPDLCGAACHRRQEGYNVEYDKETFLEVVSMQKEILFDEKACRVG